MKTEPDSYIFYLNIQRIKNNEAHFVSTMYFKLKTFLTTVRCDSYCLHIKKNTVNDCQIDRYFLHNTIVTVWSPKLLYSVAGHFFLYGHSSSIDEQLTAVFI